MPSAELPRSLGVPFRGMGKLRATPGQGAADGEAPAAALTCSDPRLHARSRGSGAANDTVVDNSRPQAGRAHPAGRFRPPHVTPRGREGGEGGKDPPPSRPRPVTVLEFAGPADTLICGSLLSISLLTDPSTSPEAEVCLHQPRPLSLPSPPEPLSLLPPLSLGGTSHKPPHPQSGKGHWEAGKPKFLTSSSRKSLPTSFFENILLLSLGPHLLGAGWWGRCKSVSKDPLVKGCSLRSRRPGSFPGLENGFLPILPAYTTDEGLGFDRHSQVLCPGLRLDVINLSTYYMPSPGLGNFFFYLNA